MNDELALRFTVAELITELGAAEALIVRTYAEHGVETDDEKKEDPQ
jgi:hypothetical protein